MKKEQLSRMLNVILHADVVVSPNAGRRTDILVINISGEKR
jgi:hypothetical protein